MHAQASTSPTDTKSNAKHGILERAARLFCEQSYEGTSMQQIAEACGLTKAGLYHHVESKEALLAAIMGYGMDVFEQQVLAHVQGITDPVERLKQTMYRNVLLCTRGWSREITVILHETTTLRGPAGDKINARKKAYVRFIEQSVEEAIAAGAFRRVDPTITAFSFLGTVLWIYKWFRSGGRLTDDAVADGMVDIFFKGLLA